MLSADQQEQFYAFYCKTSSGLHRKAFRVCGGNATDAAEALQNAYLRAMERWPTVSGMADGQRYSWMVTTVINEARQLWRAPHRYREMASDVDIEQSTNGASRSLDDVLIGLDRYREACCAIAGLVGRTGEIMALHCIAGYEVSEVAEMLHIEPATVRVHLHTGRKRLRAVISGEEETTGD